MYRIYSALIELLAASVFIIPIFAIYNKFFFHSGKRTVLYVPTICFVIYMANDTINLNFTHRKE